MNLKRQLLFPLISTVILTTSCTTPAPGPDKTIGGSIVNAAIGAGTGAIVGNQLSYTGEGAVVGAGIGALSGAIQGLGIDQVESEMLEQEEQLASLKTQNLANSKSLAQIQGKLDRAMIRGLTGGVYQVFFDADETNLRSGTVSNLEAITSSIQQNPAAYVINVIGHSDDSGAPDYNARVAASRATTVAGYIASRGISHDQIKIASYGADRPIATNTTPVGRQLNRRVDIFISRN